MITTGRLARHTVALFSIAFGVYAQEKDQEWTVTPNLNELEFSNVVPNSPALVKSLGDAAEYVSRWTLPANAEAWNRRRPVVERAFRKAIGLEKLPERTPLRPRITGTNDMGDYLLEDLIFESRPQFPVTANLYLPKPAGQQKRAAILCPIGHYLEAGKAHPDVQARCIKLAKLGFVVLVYDAIGQGERMIPGNVHHEAGYALMPVGETIAGWMVWDSMRAIDYLLTLPEVDPERIGVTGNSGGGLNTLFTAALDQRVRAAVVGGYTFEFANWIKYAGPHCTCTHLPGLFRSMEWFEIAGLIAPRALMMMQGDRDDIFPISGARRSGHKTEAIYAMLGHPALAHFEELAGEPHAYSKPYRERMYGWMVRHLLGQGSGEPVAEGEIQPLSETDPRLMCDRDRSKVPGSPTVVELARNRAAEAVARLPVPDSEASREPVRQWVRELTAPPEERAHYLKPQTAGKTETTSSVVEKIRFVSEDGEYIPGLLWLPKVASRAPTIIVADSHGKQAVAESGLVQPLVDAGFAVLAVDLRGRGETLGRIHPGLDHNFHLVASQVLMGRPLAGRRAYDLVRTVDYVKLRPELSAGDVTVVGLGDDGLCAALAAAADNRIRRVALSGYYHSFLSQMRAMPPYEKTEMRRLWNSAVRMGLLNTGTDQIDLGSVIPSALETADVPDVISLIAPRSVLFCGARREPDAGVDVRGRFRNVTAAAGKQWLRYLPEQALDAPLLIGWIQEK